MLETTPAATAFASYVPRWLARFLPEDGSEPTLPLVRAFPAAVLLTDLTGFTALSEQLSKRGAEGMEELTRRLNEEFGALIETVAAHGGDVSKFAGDALLALWPVESPADLPEAAAAALRCGLQVQRELKARSTGLAMRIGVGAGTVRTAVLGGVEGCWETVVSGSEVSRTGQAESRAAVGEVVVTPRAWGLLGEGFGGAGLEGGFVHAATAPEGPPAAAAPPLARSAQALRPFVLRCVQARIDAGQEAWLGELRRVSTLFLHLPDLGADTSLETAQEVVRVVQTAILRQEGTLNKISVDSKGAMVLAAMGLPPLGHEDDAVRCVEAALEIRDGLLGLGVGFALGVATGRVFCGSVGNARRREYTVLGTVVNLAARLMQHASGDVLCDQATWLAARDRVRFEALPAVQVKGRDEPVPVFRPRERVRAARRRSPELVGREREKALLAARLESREGGAVLVEGDPGIGKSRLLEEALEHARSLGITPLVGESDAVEKATSYFAWRPVFRRIFEDLPDEPAARREQVLRRLAPHPDLEPLAPLLDAVMPLELPDNETTRQMTGQVRADNTEHLLGEILSRLWERPALVVLEDAHWLDSASWSLMGNLVQKMPDLVVLLSTRPLEDPAPEDYTRIVARPGTLRLVLAGLSREEALDLACRRLGVPALPPAVADFVVQRAEGNPFFSQELVRSLQEFGFLEVAGDGCRLVEGVGDLRFVDVPDTVQGVVTSRLDRLEPTRLMILKVASVVGRTFRYRDFEAVYPIRDDLELLPGHLEALEALDLLRPEASGAWSFTHVITQDVAYNLMLYAQRQDLHGSLARWLEGEHGEELSTYYPLLAHHWERAAVVERALDYVERAGEQALHRGANREAAEFFGHALALGGSEPAPRLARWELGAGKATYGLGDLPIARRHLEEASRLLGLPIPSPGAGTVAGLVRELARQAWHRTALARLPEQPASSAAGLMDAADVHGLLGEIYYLVNEVLLTVYAGIRGLNLAEGVGSRTAEAAEFSARMALAFSAVPLHGIAGFYGDHALKVARQSGNLKIRTKVEWLAALQKMVLPPRWSEVFPLFESSQGIARRLGDWQNLAAALTAEGYARFYHSEFERAAEVFAETVRVARRSENRMHEEWGLSGWTGAALRLGRNEEAERLARETLAIHASGILDPTEEVRAWVNLALALHRRGDDEGALEAVASAKAVLRKHVPVPCDYHTLDAYAGIVELYLGLGERWRPECREALRAQEAYARVFPWGRPRLLWTKGRLAWAEGRPQRARDAWTRGLQEARAMEMAYEEGLCLRELGLAGEAQALEDARRLFEALGAWEVQDAERANSAGA